MSVLKQGPDDHAKDDEEQEREHRGSVARSPSTSGNISRSNFALQGSAFHPVMLLFAVLH